MKILDEFLPELTAHIAAIYREAVATHTWPESYKKEYHIPINKVPTRESEDDLRNLGLTPFFCKRLEWFLISENLGRLCVMVAGHNSLLHLGHPFYHLCDCLRDQWVIPVNSSQPLKWGARLD